MKNIKSTIKRIVLYKVIAEDQLKASTVRLIKNKKIIMILLFSVYSTDILIKLLKQEKIYRNVKSATVVCLSDRIKKRLNKYGSFRNVLVSLKPDQNSIIMAVKRNF